MLDGAVGAADIAGDEEGDEEVGEGQQVDDVDPDGKGSAGTGHAGSVTPLSLVLDDGTRRAGSGGGSGLGDGNLDRCGV